MTANEVVAHISMLRTKILTTTIDDFEGTTFAMPMLLEALSTLEVAQRKLEQANLFCAREHAGNF